MSLQLGRQTLHSLTAEDCTTIKLMTDLNEINVHTISEELFAWVKGKAQPQLRLDLGAVRFLTSTALGKFVSLHRHVKAAGGRLVLTNVTDLVREIFEVSRLDQVLNLSSPDSDDLHSQPCSTPLAS